MVDDRLSEEDVARLLASPDGGTRADIADKVAARHPRLSESERRMAEDIFRLMVKDAEVRVRQALARQLKENPLVPHDVAIALARDVDAVALPMLRYSEVLTDDDLIDIVRSQGSDKRAAVASRARVSAPVAEAVVESCDETAVAALVANQGVQFAEGMLERVAEQFGAHDAIGGLLAERRGLPVTVAERLMTRVSENIRNHLLRRRDLPPEVASALLVQARELAVLGLTNTETDAVKLIEHLHRNRRLTPSIILRAGCMGDQTFFEAALARLADVPIENARRLIHESGSRGFTAIFQKAGLPQAFFHAMRATVDVSRDMQYDGEARDRERFSRRMIERILTQYGDLGVEFETDDLEYLLGKMSQLPSAVSNRLDG